VVCYVLLWLFRYQLNFTIPTDFHFPPDNLNLQLESPSLKSGLILKLHPFIDFYIRQIFNQTHEKTNVINWGISDAFRGNVRYYREGVQSKGGGLMVVQPTLMFFFPNSFHCMGAQILFAGNFIDSLFKDHVFLTYFINYF